MSFTNLIVQKSGGKGIYYLQSKDSTGEPTWYYLKATSSKILQFEKAAQGNGQCNLNEWGEVLYSGYGEESPNYFRRKMLEDYGFKHPANSSNA